MILDNILFIHPPRCSGTSIETNFNWNNENEKHLKASIIRSKVGEDKWGNSFKFSIVRNPFDRVISMYHAPYYRRIKKGFLFESLESFIADIPVPPNEYGIECCDYIDEKIDFIIRFESREDDILKLKNSFNINIDPTIWVRRLNREKDYKKYHSSESIRLVEKKFSKDISKFNYKY
jgi:hypothetical protein